MPAHINELRRIMELQFAVLETALYLNTHPFDEKVLEKHNKLARSLQKLQSEYNQQYCPLTIGCSNFDYPWCWIDEPWPWEINF